ncbi:uncharacterized protein [Gorilla gorilla gorilla]|uniref:uncharacterized protein n=1 Tax=Gorilla gorilla gorilla TaxID=9595 RepID=UPI0024459948|nr:uncharacterized protein LOC101138465 isoform X3 [Gorilla gorilla gorilla]
MTKREREKRAGGEEQKAGGEIWHNGWERKLDASGPPFARASLEPAPRFLPSWIWGAALPGAGRSNETAKKHKMNRQSNQPKTGGSSRPARRHLLLPSLEAL